MASLTSSKVSHIVNNWFRTSDNDHNSFSFDLTSIIYSYLKLLGFSKKIKSPNIKFINRNKITLLKDPNQKYVSQISIDCLIDTRDTNLNKKLHFIEFSGKGDFLKKSITYILGFTEINPKTNLPDKFLPTHYDKPFDGTICYKSFLFSFSDTGCTLVDDELNFLLLAKFLEK